MSEPNARDSAAGGERLLPQGGPRDDADRPDWMVEAHDDLAIRRPSSSSAPVPAPRPPRRRRAVGLTLGMLVMFATGFGAVILLDGEGGTTATADRSATEQSSDSADGGAGGPATASTESTATDDTTFEIPDASDLPAGDAADRLSIQIEAPSPDGSGDGSSADGDGNSSASGGATATVREDGRVYFEGSFRSEDEAAQYIARASEVFGAEAIVEDYTIDPSAPAPSAGDVALDKPVLFESGSAEIHPDYIPFLEACGDVLKLNPQITMSISAFTDATGSAEFNLELSQRRAQAIVDFYRDLDVDDGQLVGTGFGESAPSGDNASEEGRSENRRAMLQLLNVMSDDES